MCRLHLWLERVLCCWCFTHFAFKLDPAEFELAKYELCCVAALECSRQKTDEVLQETSCQVGSVVNNYVVL